MRGRLLYRIALSFISLMLMSYTTITVGFAQDTPKNGRFLDRLIDDVYASTEDQSEICGDDCSEKDLFKALAVGGATAFFSTPLGESAKNSFLNHPSIKSIEALIGNVQGWFSLSYTIGDGENRFKFGPGVEADTQSADENKGLRQSFYLKPRFNASTDILKEVILGYQVKNTDLVTLTLQPTDSKAEMSIQGIDNPLQFITTYDHEIEQIDAGIHFSFSF